MKIKKLLSFAAAVVMAMTATLGAISASAEEENAYSGSAGENVTYSFDSTTGVLTISGTGPMYTDITDYSDWPWDSYSKDVKEVVIEEGVTSIGYRCFFATKVEKVTVPATLEELSDSCFIYSSSLKEVVGLENTKITSIPDDCFFQCTNLASIAIPKTVTNIGKDAFYYCKNEDLVIDIKSMILTTIGTTRWPEAFKYVVGTIYVYSQNMYDLVAPAAKSANIVLKQDAEKLLKEAIEYGEAQDISNYTDDSVKVLNDAITAGKVLLDNTNAAQEEFSTSIDAIYAAIDGLTYKPADYTAVDEVLTKVPSDLNLFTDATVNAVKRAIKAVNREKNITEQETVDSYVQAIDDAVAALEYLPADYTAVDEAVAKIPSDLSSYTDISVIALHKAINAIYYNKNISEQETVDGYAQAVEDAIAGLTSKPEPTEPEPTKTEPSKQEPSKPTTKTTRSPEAVKKDKEAAQKVMKQAKITKLTVKSKAKKKINVTWKKVKKAKGYQVQVSAKKNFKKSKIILTKNLKKTKLTIKNKKIKSKKTYYVRVRAYATYKDTNNKTVKVYSKWNKKLRKVKVK